ncbi:gas vesicle protein [Brachybacterium sp. P6-10-X1]|uniref:gas vesicle protein n=1 Tax=Brachybacterium sp. P6-10-X1 TaxID=1903186 RepID=UPI00268799C9|nr:gas vesicle protein [Brachybacterium sp. P6-10-X1]
MTIVPRSEKGMEPRRESEGTLIHVVETLLDKGLVLNADIMVSVAGVELLGIRLRAALASFETAARYGLEFPAGTDISTAAWQDAIEQKETCPECGKRAPLEMLMREYCPWCGWQSALAVREGDAERGDRAAELSEGAQDDGASSDDGSPAATKGGSAGSSGSGRSRAPQKRATGADGG